MRASTTLTIWTGVVLLSTTITDVRTQQIHDETTTTNKTNTTTDTRHETLHTITKLPQSDKEYVYNSTSSNKDMELTNNAMRNSSESLITNNDTLFTENTTGNYIHLNNVSDGFNIAKESDNITNNNGRRDQEKVQLDLDGFDDGPDQQYVDDAVEIGLQMMHELYYVKEPKLYKLGLYLNENEPAGRVAMFSAPNVKAQFQSKYGYAAVQASLRLKEKFPESRSRQNPEHVSFLRSSILSDQCPIRGVPRCPPASRRYRTSDGTCNNLAHPWKGASMLPMQRFLLPDYEDGIQSIRRSVSGGRLPSAREISIRIHRDRNVEMESITMMFVQWGQFLDHDITSTAQSRAFNGSIPRCCGGGGTGFLPDELMHPDCLPISIPEEDWFMGQFGMRCMEFVRSAPSSRIDCDLGWREQINQVTSYIDASTVYGSDPERAESLRIFRHGLLQYGRPRQNAHNPPDPPGGEICRSGAISTQCFKGGDLRVGEQPGLTAFHTTWLRYHNRLAAILGNLNGHWSDEKIYQETRRIVSALIQHITYKEFLPIVLGHEVMDLFDLNLLRKGFFTSYDDRVNPAPANAFSAAAFRFGHSLVQNSYVRSDAKHRSLFNNVSIHEEQDNPHNIWSFGSVDRLILGFCNQASQRRDEFIGEELTNHLFQSPGRPFGMDLAAVNIQRGRDHGIPTYTAWREPCGLSKVHLWADLEPLMPFETIQRFRTLYEHVNDIDLYSGGLAERPVRSGVVGPTFACIIAQQFANLRKGDRFWYENGDFESSFTPAQLQQLRKVTFAQILCQVLPEIETVQPFVFLSPDNFRNSRIPCNSPELDNFDLRAWTERKPSLHEEINNRNDVNRFEINNQIDSKLDLFNQESKETVHKLSANRNKIKVDNKLEFGNKKNRTQVDNKLDFNGPNKKPEKLQVSKIEDKIEFGNKNKRPIHVNNNLGFNLSNNNKVVISEKLQIDEIQEKNDEFETTSVKNQDLLDLDFDVLFFTSNKGVTKKPQIADFDIEQIFATPKKGSINKIRTRKKRNILDDTVDGFQDAFEDLDTKSSEESDFDLDDEESEYDNTGRKKTKRKKKRTRTTTRKTTTKRHTVYFENTPLTADFYNPLKIKVTNITTATADGEQKYGQYNYAAPPNRQPTRRPNYSDDLYVLHETITKPNKHQSYARPIQKIKPLDYHVNINIQYVVSSTPKTDILIKKGDINRRPQVHVVENGYNFIPTQSHSNNQNNYHDRPLPIIPLRTTTKKYRNPNPHSNYYSTTGGYYEEIYASTSRPKPNVYEIRPTYDYNKKRPNFDQNVDSFDQNEENRPGYNIPNYNQYRPSTDRPSYDTDRPSFDRPQYDRPNFDQNQDSFDQNPENGYYSPSSTMRPTNVRPNLYNYDELVAAISRPIQYNHDQFEDRPFSTSKRPYIYKPSESYLDMFDEYATTKRPDYGQYFVTGYVQKLTTRKPSIPSYLYLQSDINKYYKDSTKDVEFDDELKEKLHEVYKQLLTSTRKPDDADAQVIYVKGTDKDKDEDEYGHEDEDGHDLTLPDRYGDQGERNFVKVSSVQGNRFLADGEKEQIIHTAQPKEGDLELFEDIAPIEHNTEKNIDKVQVDVLPKQNRESDWVMYNEVDNDPPMFDEPVFKSVLNETIAKELPKPFGQFWKHLNVTGTDDTTRTL